MNKPEDLMIRAERVYEQRWKATLERTHMDSFVAIEPESGDYFLAPTMSEASEKAHEVYPDRRCAILRVGHRAAIHLGAGWT